MITEKPIKTQVPVMMAPIGKIKILVPGRMKRVLEVRAVLDVADVIADLPENAPTTKAAWVEFKVVLNAATFWMVIAVRVTVGRTRAWSWASDMFEVIAALLI